MIINLLHKAKLYTVPKNTSFSMSRPGGMYDSFCVLIIPQATALPLLEQLEWAWWHRTSAIASRHLPQITVKSAAHAVNNDLIKDKITVQTDTMLGIVWNGLIVYKLRRACSLRKGGHSRTAERNEDFQSKKMLKCVSSTSSLVSLEYNLAYWMYTAVRELLLLETTP